MTRLVQHKDLSVIVWNDLVFCLHPWLVLPTADSFIWISLIPDEKLRLGFEFMSNSTLRSAVTFRALKNLRSYSRCYTTNCSYSTVNLHPASSLQLKVFHLRFLALFDLFSTTLASSSPPVFLFFGFASVTTASSASSRSS